MQPSTSISLFPLLLLVAPRLASATCYWQNSTLAPDDPYSIAPDDTACFPDQDNSPCCGTGWTCLSDGVCYIEIDGGEYYYRGTCTDRTWDSQQCPGWCFAQSKYIHILKIHPPIPISLITLNGDTDKSDAYRREHIHTVSQVPDDSGLVVLPRRSELFV